MRYVAPRHNLELTLEVILEHVLGIKTMTLIFNPGSCSNSLSLPKNQYRREIYDLISKSQSWICHKDRTRPNSMLRYPSFVDPFLSLIISFLVQLQHHLFFSSNSQSPHPSSCSLVLYLQLGAERPTTQSYDSRYGLPVTQVYLG